MSLFQFSHTRAIKMTSCFVNRGNTGTAHAASTTGFAPDNWNSLRDANLLGPGWRCYDPAKDLVVPPWNEAAKVGAGKSPTAEQYPHHLTVTLHTQIPDHPQTLTNHRPITTTYAQAAIRSTRRTRGSRARDRTCSSSPGTSAPRRASRTPGLTGTRRTRWAYGR